MQNGWDESIFSQIAQIFPKLLLFGWQIQDKKGILSELFDFWDHLTGNNLLFCENVLLYICIFILIFLYLFLFFFQVHEWEKWFSIFTQILCYECVKERKYLLNMFDLYFSFHFSEGPEYWQILYFGVFLYLK